MRTDGPSARLTSGSRYCKGGLPMVARLDKKFKAIWLFERDLFWLFKTRV